MQPPEGQHKEYSPFERERGETWGCIIVWVGICFVQLRVRLSAALWACIQYGLLPPLCFRRTEAATTSIVVSGPVFALLLLLLPWSAAATSIVVAAYVAATSCLHLLLPLPLNLPLPLLLILTTLHDLNILYYNNSHGIC